MNVFKKYGTLIISKFSNRLHLIKLDQNRKNKHNTRAFVRKQF